MAESGGRFKEGIGGVGRAGGSIGPFILAVGDVGYRPGMSSDLMLSAQMTVADFLAWDAPSPGRWQLVDGEPVAMPRTSRTHGALLAEIGSLIVNGFAANGGPGSAIALPGILPRIRASDNFRIPSRAVTYTRYETEEYVVSNPVLIVEILSPSNRAEIWQNVWSYSTIPSLRGILIFSSTTARAELLRRGGYGNWPAAAMVIEDGALILESIGLTVSLAAIYRTTRLASA